MFNLLIMHMIGPTKSSSCRVDGHNPCLLLNKCYTGREGVPRKTRRSLCWYHRIRRHRKTVYGPPGTAGKTGKVAGSCWINFTEPEDAQ